MKNLNFTLNFIIFILICFFTYSSLSMNLFTSEGGQKTFLYNLCKNLYEKNNDTKYQAEIHNICYNSVFNNTN